MLVLECIERQDFIIWVRVLKRSTIGNLTACNQKDYFLRFLKELSIMAQYSKFKVLNWAPLSYYFAKRSLILCSWFIQLLASIDVASVSGSSGSLGFFLIDLALWDLYCSNSVNLKCYAYWLTESTALLMQQLLPLWMVAFLSLGLKVSSNESCFIFSSVEDLLRLTSLFCRQLTSIEQMSIKEAFLFRYSLLQYQQWLMVGLWVPLGQLRGVRPRKLFARLIG